MLKITFNPKAEILKEREVTFEEWVLRSKENYIESELGRKIIKAVDNCDVIDRWYIESPICGRLPTYELSGVLKLCYWCWQFLRVKLDFRVHFSGIIAQSGY